MPDILDQERWGGSVRAGCSGSGWPTTRRARPSEPYKIYNKKITITGSMALLHSYERTAELFTSGVLDPAVFLTDRLPLERYVQAWIARRRGGLKTLVLP